MQHTSMKNVMFHANDKAKHSVYWSDIAEQWMVENANVGWLQGFPYLCSALTHMHVITGDYYGLNYSPSKYRMMVPEHWTMTENPYA